MSKLDNIQSEQIVLHNVEELTPHPLNKQVYGNESLTDTEELTENIKENGVLTPFLITPKKTIISGHRRREICLRLNIKMVPTIVLNTEDELILKQILLSANAQREKSNEQKIREYSAHKEIETQLAKQRQIDGGKKSSTKSDKEGVDNSPPPKKRKGKARDIAAEKVSLAGKTAEDGLKVIREIEHLIEVRDFKEAGKLQNALNKSIHAASKLLKSSSPKKKKVHPSNKKYGDVIVLKL